MIEIILFLLFLIVAIAIGKARNAEQLAREARKRVDELEAQLRKSGISESRNLSAARKEAKLPERVPSQPAHETQRFDLPEASTGTEKQSRPAQLPPPLPTASHDASKAPPADEGGLNRKPDSANPPRPAFSIEQFLGVKLFAWLGGIALFFGVIFFVRYAFEHDLISPSARVGLGFLTGLALLIGGWTTNRLAKYRVLAHALCATGVVTLYGVSFAGHAVYQLPLFSTTLTFVLMTMVTVAAFATAVRNDALVIAVIGMLAGFITPILLPMVQDHPSALFGYTALLDIGLLALAVRGRWTFLSCGAAVGTITMFSIWIFRFFLRENYHLGAATLTPMGILSGFTLLFLAAAWRTSRTGTAHTLVPIASFAVTTSAFLFGFFFLAFHQIANRELLLYGFVLLVNLAAIALSLSHRRFWFAWILAGAATFLHLAAWLLQYLERDNLPAMLTIILIFGSLYTLLPTIASRIGHGTPEPFGRGRITAWIPTLSIGLMALGLLLLDDVAFIFWPAILIANLLCLAACTRSRFMMPVLASLAATLFACMIWLFLMPEVSSALNQLLGVVLGFTAFFGGGGFWLAHRFAKEGAAAARNPQLWIPVGAASMPFLLLNLAIIELPMPDPSAVFASAFLLAALLCGIALRFRTLPLVAVAFALCSSTLFLWHADHFSTHRSWPALAWYLGYLAVFTLVPFVFRKTCHDSRAPWITSALAGPVLFVLIHHVVSRAYPSDWMGWLPAAFAVPSLGLLFLESRFNGPSEEPGKTRLAWFGGASLFFITLIFPIQFDHQWLTLAWSLEGAALIWLFRHVPHGGLLGSGFALLTTGFIRLAVNPAVFVEYERSGGAILNWHLYVYGICSLATLAGGLWLPSTTPAPLPRVARGILFCFAGILLFLLMNIQIADFFTEPGARFIAFEFSGNFARDMSYTIGWALFALALLVVGIITGNKGGRYAAIGLLATALLKLFLHDLATIESIFRIAALLCTGVIAFVASFLYQKFVPNTGAP